MCNVEPGKDQKLTSPGSGNIPKPNSVAFELALFSITHILISRRLHAENRTIESVVLAVDYGTFRRHVVGHRVDGHDDWPLKALCRMHGVENDVFFLRIGPAFDCTRLVRPRGCHGLGEGAKSANGESGCKTNIK